MAMTDFKSQLSELLADLEVELFDLIGSEFAPKRPGGSPERRRLLKLLKPAQGIMQQTEDATLALIADTLGEDELIPHGVGNACAGVAEGARNQLRAELRQAFGLGGEK